MNRFHKSVARALMLVTILQPLVSTAEGLRYHYTLYGGNDYSNANLPPHWEVASPVYGDWTNVRSIYGCSNWSPSPSTVGKGIDFEQSATDCKQDQERWVQPQIKNDETGEVADYQGRTVEYRTINGKDARTATGILENWFTTTPKYTPWADTNALYECSSWTPSPSIYTKTASFTQTSTACKTDQTRQRQDREQEMYSGEIRDSGMPVTENQTVTGRQASRNYTVKLSEWVNKGEKTTCSNWSPAANTIDLDVEFTQIATDCQQEQGRVRNESYIDHKTGALVSLPPINETQTLTGQTATKQIKGTKIPLTINVSGANAAFTSSPFSVNWSGNGASEYLIKGSQAASGLATTDTSVGLATSKSVTATGNGEFAYTVTAKNNLGESLSAKKVVAVENAPTYTGLKVNGQTDITVSPNETLTFASEGLSQGASLVGRDPSNSSIAALPKFANAGSGSTTYYASAAKTVNGVTKYSSARSVSVTVVDAPTITSFTAPASVFVNEAMVLKWAAVNGSTYRIRGSSQASGVSPSDSEVSSTGITVKPSAAGSYTYTLTVTNAAGVSTSSTISAQAEPSPTITSFKSTPQSVAAGATATLSWETSAATAMSIDQSVGVVTGTRKTVNVGNTAGSKAYTLTLSKTVNGVTRTASSSTTVSVIAAPLVSIDSAPSTNVFVGSPFTLGWSGSNAASYSIKGNNAASGISTTEANLGTSKSLNITATAAGTYTYTLTATNSVGVTTSTSKTVTVEAEPTITSFTASSTTVTVGGKTTLSWVTTGTPSLSLDQGVGSVSALSFTQVDVGTILGTKTYTLSASKTLNGVTKSTSKAVTLNVIAAPAFEFVSAPQSNVFAGSPFTLTWKGTNVSKYTILGSTDSSGVSSAGVDVRAATTYTITPTAAGSYGYTVHGYNAAGADSGGSKTIVVVDAPTIDSFSAASTSVQAGSTVDLTWSTTGTPTLAIDQGVGAVTGSTIKANVGTTPGTKTFTLTATKVLNGVTKSVNKSVSVTVVAAPTVSITTAPATNVFVGSPFTLGWSGSSVASYSISANNAASGITTQETSLGGATSKAITPTAAGTYTYAIVAKNSLGVTETTSVSVTVEAAPSITAFSSNQSAATAGASVTLTWAATGSPSLSIDQSVGAVTGTSAVTSVGSITGTKTFTLTASKTLNGVTKTTTKTASVTVYAAPSVAITTAPSTNVFVGAPFSLGWAGTGASSYSIKANNAASGVATTDTAIGTSTSQTVTPTAAGTYTYTITATNAAGTTTTTTKTIVVEAAPTITSFTAGASTVSVSANTTLSWVVTGSPSLSVDQGIGAVSGASVNAAVGSATGTKTFTLTATKVLNGITKTATKTASVSVVSLPTVSISSSPNTNVFVGSAFNLGWTGAGATSYSIKSNATASGIATTDTNLGTATSKAINPSAAGSYIYTVTATNAAGDETTVSKTVIVEAAPTITSLTAGATSATAGTTVSLSWATTGSPTLSIDQSVGTVSGTTATVNVGTTVGTKTYTLTATKVLNGVTKTATKSVSIAVIAAPTVAISTAPTTNVFAGASFTLGWTATGATSYTIKGSNAASGIATSDTTLATATSKAITPTAAGTYTYTITATNALGATSSTTKSVVVEAAPTITSLTITSPATVGTSVTMSWATTGSPALSLDQGIGSVSGTSQSVNVGTATGVKTYTLTASKTLNGVTKKATKAASVTVVAAPTVSISSAPATNVFVGSPFNLGWSGTGATSYSIKGNIAASGLPTSETAMGSSTSKAVTPTAAGTYTYTITATNAAGTTTTTTKTIVVEAAPTITSFTAGASTVSVSANTTLSWVVTGSPTLAIDQGIGAVSGASVNASVGSVTGTKTFTLTTTKVLNGITKTATKAVSVSVVSLPTVSISSSPSTNVFVGSAFNLGWTGAGATSYSIKSNAAASGIATTVTNLGTATSRAINPTAAGSYIYTVTATNAAGDETTVSKTVIVEAAPTITSFAAGATSATAGTTAALSWATTGSPTLSIDQSVGTVSGTTATVKVGTTVGTKTYTLTATKVLNGVTKTATKSVSIAVIAAPTVAISTAPTTNVFAGASFTLGWTATGATSYTIRGSNAASGIATSDTALATATSKAITPTAAGTYTYTITATNALGATSSTTKSVVVEAAPTITSLTITSPATVGTSVTMAWATTGSPALSLDQGIGSVSGTSQSVNVGTATGVKTYTLTASKTLNGVTKKATKAASVTVVAAPTVLISSAPATNVFVGSPFNLGWSGTGATSYSIKGNIATSGLPTSETAMGSSTSKAVTPTAAGTYTYTITAKNDVGTTATITKSIVVEAAPTITALSAAATSATAGTTVALSWATSGAPSISIDHGIGAVTGTSLAVNVGTTTGVKTYTLTATKVLNGITKTATKSVSVTVIAAPTVTIGTAPTTNVFVGSAFTIGWSGSGAARYSIKGNATASGLATTDTAMATATSKVVTPTAAGTYTYTVTATNSLGATASATKSITVEAAPTISALTASATAVAAGGNATLTWATTGSPTLSIDQSVGTVTGTSKAIAVGTTAGAKTYTLTATKALNGVTKTATKSVTVTIVAAPTVTIGTAPATNVFVSSKFTLGWTGSNVNNYSIKGNVAASGIPTTGIAVNVATSQAITPTAPGTYVYTVTAVNSVGVSVSTTRSVTVEALPALTTFSAVPNTVIAGESTTLSWSQTNADTLRIEGVGTVSGSNLSVSVGTSLGAKTYTMVVSKTLNGVEKSASKSVSINVTEPPEDVYTSTSRITCNGDENNKGSCVFRWENNFLKNNPKAISSPDAFFPEGQWVELDGYRYTAGKRKFTDLLSNPKSIKSSIIRTKI